MTTYYSNVDEAYWCLCNHLLGYGNHVAGTRELNNMQIEIKDITDNVVSIRDISVPYMFAELIWYFTGRNDVAFIGKFASLWNKISDDGVTNNSAYGYLMQYAFGFNQIEKMVELLKKDPNSRRAVINLNTPRKEVIETKDEPCTIALQFLLRDGKLNCTTVMRSNDIYFGFPYDVIFFTELQKIIADRLGVGYGKYTHFAGSLHMYDRDKEKIMDIAAKPISTSSKPVIWDRAAFYGNLWAINQCMIEALNPVKHGDVNAEEVLMNVLKHFKVIE